MIFFHNIRWERQRGSNFRYFVILYVIYKELPPNKPVMGQSVVLYLSMIFTNN